MLHLSKIALDNGGTIVPLIIPSEETNQTGLCNPSIYVDGDDILVNVRNVNYTLLHSIGAKYYKDEGGKFYTRWGPLSYLHDDDYTLRTTNFLGFLDNDLNLVKNFKVDTTKEDIEPNWGFIGLEDARIVRWNNKLYLTGVRRDVHSDGQGRMELSEIYITPSKVQEISRCRIEVPFESYCDKNWMPILDMPYHYVRWSNPLEIMKVDPERGTSEMVQKSDNFLDVSWNEGEQEKFSGSSQVIPWDNGCRLAVIHECQWWRWSERDPVGLNTNKDARYKHRILLWDVDWNLIKYTDPFTFMDGQIEFCCGATTMGDDLVISFGFQDNAAYLLKINKDVINNLFKNNIKTSHKPVTYNKEDYHKLRLKFNGSEKIEKNYSQVGQDLFVLHMLDGKKNGTYLEVGSGRPFYGNNTFLLEELGWYGVGIELYEPFLNKHKFSRQHKVFGIDALTIDYNQFLNENFTTKNIDYLQLDIDPAQNTFDVLKSIPFDTYKFAVITYEHDHYQDTTSTIRMESRKYLESFGYELVVANISPDENSPFEDWWVHPDLVDRTRINNAKFLNKDVVDIKDYMFKSNIKTYFISFGNELFEKQLKKLSNEARETGWFDGVIVETPATIQNFINIHKDFIYNNTRGFGYWIWKPFIILKQLNKMRENDYLFYVDAGSKILPQRESRFKEYFTLLEQQPVWGSATVSYLEKAFQKMSLLKRLDLNNQSFLESYQIESGKLFVRKCQESVDFIQEWSDLCIENNYKFVTDDLDGEEQVTGFLEHRHDQSILSALIKKRNWKWFDEESYGVGPFFSSRITDDGPREGAPDWFGD